MNADLCVIVPGVSGPDTPLLSVFREVSGLVSPEASAVSVGVLATGERPGRLDSPVDVASSAIAFPLSFFVALESGWILSSFNVCIGMSATPIIMDVAVPIKALAPPVMGSIGPSSIANSRARYLSLLDSLKMQSLRLLTI
jgi:hypothetical protein